MSDDEHEAPRDPGGDPVGDPVGELGEEAAKLLAVLAGWTKAVDEHVATGAPECQWCPVCRMVHVVRSSPEVRDHLVTAASSLVQAAAGLLATTPPAESAPATDDAEPGVDGGLEHIDLDPEEGP